MLHSSAGLSLSETEIVDMQFSFNNRELLEILAARADALKMADKDELLAFEMLLDKVKTEQFDQIRTPNTFFCTFEDAYASQALLKLDQKVRIGNHEITV